MGFRARIGALLLMAAAAVGCGAGGGAGRVASGTGDAGPELTLSGMDMSEVRPGGVRYRLTADRATYALAGKTVSATGVEFRLQERAGEVRVVAPAATWRVAERKADFPEGCTAAYPGGYSASVPFADVDLGEGVLSASGPSRFDGPGFAVTGGELVWRWREGKADLKQPKAVVAPGVISALKKG
jgi:hypothetical protein